MVCDLVDIVVVLMQKRFNLFKQLFVHAQYLVLNITVLDVSHLIFCLVGSDLRGRHLTLPYRAFGICNWHLDVVKVHGGIDQID